jgi:hypothetical protein
MNYNLTLFTKSIKIRSKNKNLNEELCSLPVSEMKLDGSSAMLIFSTEK